MASKSKRRGRVFRASCILAALIIAGSSFAWFTSKDEVTNRLSANANYGTSIVEDFTPPENLLPGQKVNKDVGVVNTGNIDALVRVHLEGAVNVLKEQAVVDESALKYTAASTSGGTTTPSSYALPDSVTISDTTDESLKALGLTKTATVGGQQVYFRTLSTIERDNPELSNETNNETTSDGKAIEATNDEVNHYSEVESVQAGGYLAYASGAFEFIPENSGYTYIGSDGKTTNVQVNPTKVTSADINNTWNTGVGLEIDSDTFKPTSSGLFIFRRNVTEDATNGTYYEYSGYYYDKTNDLYYALHYLPNEGGTTYKSDYVIYSTKETAEDSGNALTITYDKTDDIKTPVVSVLPTRVKLFSAAYTRTSGIVGTYDSASPGKVTFTTGSDNNTIKVVANLANIGVSPEGWTAITETGSHTYFYYNNDVEEGDTTSKLVDSVELDKNTKKSAYLAMDFDLSVLLDSVQITVAEDGKEEITPAKETWSTINNDSTIATYDANSTEIKSITWAQAASPSP